MDPGEPSKRDLADARTLQRDLVGAFTLPMRASDSERLDEVRRICQMLRLSIEDQSCLDCLRHIERYAACFFIASDEVDWIWHTPAAYGRLQDLLQRLVRALGLRLTHLEIRRRSLEVGGNTEAARLWSGLSRRIRLHRSAAPSVRSRHGGQP